jgi:5-methylcytosine-specific restriction enzyme subunit McrC
MMTPARRVVLAELDAVGKSAYLSEAEATLLAGTGLVEVRLAGGGDWRLLPCGKVGAVRIGDLDVQVRPKTDIAQLIFLLGYAADPGFRPSDVEGISSGDLWPALTESVARQADRALGPGVLHGYESRDEALSLVRGRIRVGEQIARRPGMLLPLEVQYDDYGPDIPENQILRTALRHMAKVPGLSKESRGRLARLDSRLDGVRVLQFREPLPTWRLSRVNSRYVPALRLAEIVLRNQSAESGQGGVAVASFVVSMPKVFEDFVTVALREALAGSPGETDGQYPGHLDEKKFIKIRPDIVHVRNDVPDAVFDAKYKLEDDSSGYPNADAYQMLAYCTALRLKRGWLVYAEGTSSAAHQVLNTEISIVPYPLDLTASPTALLSQVQHLADQAIDSSIRLCIEAYGCAASWVAAAIPAVRALRGI